MTKQTYVKPEVRDAGARRPGPDRVGRRLTRVAPVLRQPFERLLLRRRLGCSQRVTAGAETQLWRPTHTA